MTTGAGSASELREQAIRAYHAGDRALARSLLEESARIDRTNEQTFLWLSEVVETPEERHACLRYALRINPRSHVALAGLAWIEQHAQQRTAGRGSAATPVGPLSARQRARRRLLPVLALVLGSSALLLIALLTTQSVTPATESPITLSQRLSFRWLRHAPEPTTRATQPPATATSAPTRLADRMPLVDRLVNLDNRVEAPAGATTTPTPAPEIIFAYIRRGEEKEQRGNLQGAIEDYSIALRSAPANAQAYFNRGRAYVALGHPQYYKLALNDYTTYLQLRPNDAEGYHQRGRAHHALRDYAGAMSDFDRAIELGPNTPQPYKSRGNLRSDLGDHEGAIADFTTAIELDPSYVDAYNDRAVSRFILGDYQGSIDDNTILLSIDPEVSYAANVFCGRGQAYYELGEYAKAEADCSKAIELKPALLPPYYHRGRARFQLTWYQAAIDDFTRFLEAYRSHAFAYEYRGRCYEALKQSQQALADYQQAAEIFQAQGNTAAGKRVQERIKALQR